MSSVDRVKLLKALLGNQFPASPERQWLKSIGFTELPKWSIRVGGRWDKVEWEKSPEATKFFNELLTQGTSIDAWEEAPPHQNGARTHLRKLKLSTNFCEFEEDPSLYVPLHTRGVCRQARKLLASGDSSAIAVVGPPGIGKSFCGARFLLLELLSDHKTGLFVDVKNEMEYLFTPSSTCLNAMTSYEVYQRFISNPGSAVLEDRNNWYIVDPGKPGQYETRRCAANTVIFASPELGHYKELVKRGTILCMIPWSEDELLDAVRLGMGRKHFPSMSQKEMEDVVLERIQTVGGLPRYVLCEQKRLRERESKVNEWIWKLENQNFLDGVMVSESILVNRTESPSVILHNRWTCTPSIENGEPVLSDNPFLYFPSGFSWLHHAAMLEQCWRVKKSAVLKRIHFNEGRRVADGTVLEQLLGFLLTRPTIAEGAFQHEYRLELEECRPQEPRVRIGIPEGLERVVPILRTSHNSALEALKALGSTVDSITYDLCKRSKRVLYANSKNNPVFDFALAPNVLINVTLNHHHSLSATALRKVFLSLYTTEQLMSADKERYKVFLIWVTMSYEKEVDICPTPSFSSTFSETDRRSWGNIFSSCLHQCTTRMVYLPR
eukprot:TRINITY_DN563_c0_g1_i1.p1 TRINITY_DN563_c0_g1~~TRINITY_DN563_c0_g1_i1.p1  ORF type:complete len:676 (-),score=76.09 TRINITY_DN563_c0_g1_i1:1805-3628(-)